MKKNALKNNSYRLPKSIIVYLPSRFSKKKGKNKIKTVSFGQHGALLLYQII
jgi:hypothetical protein